MQGEPRAITDFDAVEQLRSYHLMSGEQKIKDELEALFRHLKQAATEAHNLMFSRFRGEFRDFGGERLAIESLHKVVADIRNDVLELDRLTSP